MTKSTLYTAAIALFFLTGLVLILSIIIDDIERLKRITRPQIVPAGMPFVPQEKAPPDGPAGLGDLGEAPIGA